MYVFSRKKNESLVIGNDIRVTVVEIRGDKVRLGIEHPLEVSVHRREVFDAIHRQEVASPSRVGASSASNQKTEGGAAEAEKETEASASKPAPASDQPSP